MPDLPSFILPADLPENWQNGQIVSPDGVSVGLTKQHGFNALNQYVNDAQRAINQLREYLEAAGFATQESVNTSLASLLPKSGGTMTGIIDHGGKRATNVGTPTAATDAATKQYVDTATGLLLPKAGGTMTGAINMGSKKITNLATPTAATDASTKGYVDGAVGGLSGLLSGGRVRRIYGGFTNNKNYKYGVASEGLVLNDKTAIFISTADDIYKQAFFVMPDNTTSPSDTQGFLFYPYRNYNGGSTSTSIDGGYWNYYSSFINNVNIGEKKYNVFYINTVLDSYTIGVAIFYSPKGFLYAD